VFFVNFVVKNPDFDLKIFASFARHPMAVFAVQSPALYLKTFVSSLCRHPMAP
jgi:hypothetical protein